MVSEHVTASTAEPPLRADSIPAEVLRFAAEVGAEGPVTVIGGGTHTALAGVVLASSSANSSSTGQSTSEARKVRAPAGVWEYEPSEMTVRCGAGTTLAELDAVLTPSGQMVPFDASGQATVGGVLATGISGYRRLRYGHVRDLVLQTRHVDHAGQVVTAGGPTVKNVSGYDLSRLLVGSWGTLGFLAEVILRCLPMPTASQWLVGNADPFEVRDMLYRPSSILWDGSTTWVLLEGHPDDVASEAKKLVESPLHLQPAEQPSALGEWLNEWQSAPRRVSLRPSELRNLPANSPPTGSAEWLAEVGVGVARFRGDWSASTTSNPSLTAGGLTASGLPTANTTLMQSIKQRLDPSGRLNPGVQPW